MEKIRLFADDTNKFVISKDLMTLFASANNLMSDLFMWLVCNKLPVNSDKTNYMIFKPSCNVIKTISDSNLNCIVSSFFCIIVQYNCIVSSTGMLLTVTMSNAVCFALPYYFY